MSTSGLRFASLTPAQKELISTKKIDTAMTAEGWIAFMSPLAALDRAGDAKRGPIGCVSGLLFVGMFVTLVIGLFPVAAILLVAAIILLVLWLRLKKHDIPNALREFVLPLIAVLREDIEPDESIHLRLDLRGGTQNDKKQRAQVVNEKGYPKVSLDFFTDPWMHGQAKLVDGSTVSWDIVDDIRQRNVTKKNYRGKVKHKTKYKVRRTMGARIALPNEDYTVAGSTDGRNEGLRIKVKEGEKRSVFQTRKRTVETAIDTSPEVGDLLALITGAYQRVSPNHGGEKS